MEILRGLLMHHCTLCSVIFRSKIPYDTDKVIIGLKKIGCRP